MMRSPCLRRNVPDPGAMRGNIRMAEFEMHALVRRRLRFRAHAGTPWFGWPDRPRGKAAAAVRADIAEFVLDAIRTERAFIAADAGFRCVGRKVLVAIFAVRSKLQRHDGLSGWSEDYHRKSNARFE